MDKIRSDGWRQEYLLDEGWTFVKSEIPAAHKFELDDNEWQKITIPHTWNGYDAQNGGSTRKDPNLGYYRGPGVYRYRFEFKSEWKDKRIFLKFEAVSSQCEVFLNETLVGSHQGAFGAFTFDITDSINTSQTNLIVVKADNSPRDNIPPSGGDFPIFGGIYRPIHLIIKNTVGFSLLDYSTEGVYLTQKKVSKEQASIEITSVLANPHRKLGNCTLITKIRDSTAQIVLKQEQEISIDIGEKNQNCQEYVISRPHLWHGKQDPYLYEVEVDLVINGEILDRFTHDLGFRSYEIKNRGRFHLNGEEYPLNGVCRHQDWPDIGWALSNQHHDKDITLIDEIGANTIRLAHYQQSEYFYSLCDQKGILVYAENCLVNGILNNKGFHQTTVNALTELIKQAYNHSSIFTWGLSNEILQGNSDDPIPLLQKLHSKAKELDPFRPTVCALNTAAFKKRKMFDIPDLTGWNIYPGWYSPRPKAMFAYARRFLWTATKNGFCISEYGAGGSINHHEKHPKRPKPRGNWHPEEWQAVAHERAYKYLKSIKYIWGSYIWNMFDFASVWRSEGDADGINDKGLVTRDRLVKKDAFYFYKAQWSNQPFIYITGKRFTRRTTKRIDIKIYSNCTNLTLIVNGQEIPMSRSKSPNNSIYIYPRIPLVEGKNEIFCRAKRDSLSLEDHAEWEKITD